MRTFVFVCLATATLMSAVAATSYDSHFIRGNEWNHWGRDIENSRHNPDSKITPHNIDRLVEKWRFTPAGNVATTIAALNGIGYVPDAGGYVYAFSIKTGVRIWTTYLPTVLGIPGAFSRTTPIIHEDRLFLGLTLSGSPIVFALNRETGALIWKSLTLDPHPAAIVTMSGTYNHRDNTLIFGVSSNEEALAANASYPCCSFRGSAVVLHAHNGEIKCQQYLTPILPNGTIPFPGVANWGSSPPIDYKRGTFFIATGNNYNVPAVLENCVDDVIASCNGSAVCEAAGVRGCTAMYDTPRNHLNSIMALDLETCSIHWATRVSEYDAWTVACLRTPRNANCPTNPGPDADFGQAPVMMTLRNGTDVVVVGQKSGIMWTICRDTGAIIHGTQLGPGGTTGGFQWGLSKIAQVIYGTSVNTGNLNQTLPDGRVINWGSILAYSPDLDRVIWNVPEPVYIPGASHPLGAVSTGNDLVFVTSVSGNAYAFHAKSGHLLWVVNPHGNSIASGITVLEDTVIFGTGYRLQSVTTEVPVIVGYGLPDEHDEL